MTSLRSAYARVATVLRPFAIWRLRLGQTDLGDLVDGIINRLLPGERTAREIALAWGGVLWLPPGYMDANAYGKGIFEVDTTEAFFRILRPGMTVVDVGAHLGYFTILSSKLVGESGHVYAFEADPFYAEWLRHNVRVNGCSNVVVLDLAVGAGEVTAYFHTHPGGSGGSLYRSRPTSRMVVRKVRTASLDRFLGDLGWPRVDLVKLDIEGGECAALRGMKAVVRRNPDMKCIVEFELRAMRAAAVTPSDLMAILESTGLPSIHVLDGRSPGLQLPLQLDDLIHLAERFLYVNLLCEA